MKQLLKAFCLSSILFLAVGCGGSDDESDGNGGAAPAQACSGQSDCPEEHACVTIAGESFCQPTCNISADVCGSNASCGGVGVMSINVCTPAEEAPAASEEETTEEAAPAPEEQPSLPCGSDADCAEFDANAICAQFEGVKDCTIPCAEEADCDMPAIGGFSVDFLTCLPDEADSSRSACLPDAACFADPMSCVTLPSAGDLEGLLPDTEGFGEDFDEGGEGGGEEEEEEEDPFDDFDF